MVRTLPNQSLDKVIEEMYKVYYQQKVDNFELTHKPCGFARINNLVLAFVNYSTVIIGRVIDKPVIDGYISYQIKPIVWRNDISICGNSNKCYVNDFEVYEVINEL